MTFRPSLFYKKENNYIASKQFRQNDETAYFY